MQKPSSMRRIRVLADYLRSVREVGHGLHTYVEFCREGVRSHVSVLLIDIAGLPGGIFREYLNKPLHIKAVDLAGLEFPVLYHIPVRVIELHGLFTRLPFKI